MSTRMMRGALLLNAIVLCGLAVTISRAAAQSIEIDCTESPREAVLTLPRPADSWGQIVCTKYGHVITSKPGWVWTRPGAYSPVWMPAQMVRQNPKEVGNELYFKHISVRELDTAEAKTWLLGLEQDLGLRAEDPSGPIYEIRANPSDRDEDHYLWTVMTGSERGIWARLCAARCDYFLILSVPPRK